MIGLVSLTKLEVREYPRLMKKKLISTLLVAGALATTMPANAATAGGVLKSTAGVIGGTIVGAFFTGPVRGSSSLGIKAANGLADAFGGKTVGKVFGYPIGAFAGGFAGAFLGLAKGAVQGVHYGIKDPLTDKNFSVDGEFQDFDALDFDLG